MARADNITSTLKDSETAPSAFSLPLGIWDSYIKYRPNYPASLWNTWLDYHQGQLSTAHDLGTGCGLGAAKLMAAAQARQQPIKTMILSDPADSNIQTTKDILASGILGDFPNTSFVFHQRPGEDSFLPPGSVDIAVACESFHWMDCQKALASIYASLRPGGTFAAVYYSTLPTMRIKGNDKATEALRTLVREQDARQDSAKWRRSKAVQLGLNYVPLDKALWEDVVRTWYNVAEGDTNPPNTAASVRDAAAAISMLDAETETFRWAQDEVGWTMQDCTLDYLKRMFKTTYFPGDTHTWDEKPWKDFEDAIREKGECFDVVLFATTFVARKRT